jgi:hypothetical protein
MAFQQTITWTRTTPVTPWFEWDENIKNHIKTEYIETGKLLKAVITESSDGLTKTTVRTFAAQGDYEEFRTDSVLEAVVPVRNSYATVNNLTLNEIP